MEQRENRIKKKKRRTPVNPRTTLKAILYNYGNTERLFEEIMAKIFPNLVESKNKSQETLRTRNMKKPIPRYIIIKS